MADQHWLLPGDDAHSTSGQSASTARIVERHSSLLRSARERRVEELGYDNIELRVGDGTAGWEDVPRETFVEAGFEEFAYEDSPLSIVEDQTISQPYIVAAMIEAAEVKPGDRVFEVGTIDPQQAAKVARERYG
jgi:protein-L-isoaspartate O-methyltransferase